MYRLKKFLDSFLRALSVLAIAFILVIGSFLVYYFISIKIYEEKGSSYKPAIMLYNIISQSMEPNINVYDVVVDKSIKDIKEIKENDVITFISKSPISYNYIITHRIIDVYETEYGVAFLTKGDNNKLADEALVYEDQILGKMILKYLV
jgi:signal peptidase